MEPKTQGTKGKHSKIKNAMNLSNQHSDTKYKMPRLMQQNSFDVEDHMTTSHEVSKRTNKVGPQVYSPQAASADSEIVLNQAEYSY